jgi:Spy/CpxP family protein refolding chaperone
MKRLLTLLIILLCFASFSFAQQVIQQNGDHKDGGKTMKKNKRVESYMLVQQFLMNAENLDLTYSQRQELDNIKKDYLYPMIQKEADFQISETKVTDMLKEPDFDPEKVKSAIETSIKLTLENAIMSIDALAAIRNAVGMDNFNKLREMMNLMPGEMWNSNDKIKKNQDSSSEQNIAL